jgi:hypothetical protein
LRFLERISGCNNVSVTLRVYGVDFSSAPSTRKPITIAAGILKGSVYSLERVVPVPNWDMFDDFLGHPGPWLAGFDMPFSLPRPLIEHYGWPSRYEEFIQWYGAQPREWLRQRFKAFCNARPCGSKFVYRQTDRPAGSSPAMRWTNPPVAWMLHAGTPRLLKAGLHIPRMHQGIDRPRAQRVALEAYPGFTARHVTRRSYKSDLASKQTPERYDARQEILQALRKGQAGLSVRLEITAEWQERFLQDGSGDLIDAAICALQASHAHQLPGFGFPRAMDPLEGWIASVPKPSG